MVQDARRRRAKQHFPSSKSGKQSEVCAPAAPALPRPLRPCPGRAQALPRLSPGSLRHTCPGALPSRGFRPPRRTPPPRGDTFPGRAEPGRPRPAASTTHPAQPREPGASVSAKFCRRPHRLSNFPAARERPLPASAREPEGSVAAILGRLCGPTLTGGGGLREGVRADGGRRALMGSTERGLGAERAMWRILGLITDSSSFSRLSLDCDSALPPFQQMVAPVP